MSALRSTLRCSQLLLATALTAGLVGCKGNVISEAADSVGFSIAVVPTSLTVAPGGVGSAQVTLIRTTFTDTVSLSLTGLPAGVTASFSPTSVAGTTATLALTVGAAVPVGTYQLTLTGNAVSGGQSTTFGLTIATSTGSSGNISQIDVGTQHTCAIKASGQLFCWGRNNWGQVGDGSVFDRGVPTLVSGAVAYSMVQAGEVHTCAIATNGAAYCWGNNGFGGLGDGTNTDHIVPAAISGGLRFASITARGNPGSSCGLTTTNAAYCWGANSGGISGDGTILTHFLPTAVSNGTFASLSASETNVCGVKLTGVAYCWGGNMFGQVGDGTVYSGSFNWSIPTVVAGGLAFASVSAGTTHTCGITLTGVGYCWGLNDNGQLGDGTGVSKSIPTLVSGGLKFGSIKAGNQISCGITLAGAAYCWGWNGFGQLGDGTTTNRLVPTAVGGNLVFTKVSPGQTHTCGLAAATIYCWGSNSNGQLGDASFTDRLLPTAAVFQ